MKKLVLGIGNPILGDDGVGFRVVESLQESPPPGDVTITACDVSGLGLLDLLVGFDEALIIDAIQTVAGKPGDIYRLEVGDFRTTKHSISPHDTDLPTALEIGKLMKLKLPHKISIIAIEIPTVYEFSTKLSPDVGKAVIPAVQKAREILSESGTSAAHY